MRVLVVPEDSRRDKFILKPLFKALFRSIGKPKAYVSVCEDPIFGSVNEVLKSSRIEDVITRYQMVSIFILCVDRDGETGRRQRLNQIEEEFGGSQVILAENAWEEIETWVLAGLKLPKEWRWPDVRAEVQVKERYFGPFALQRGVSNFPGGGRKPLGEEAARRIAAIRQKCPDDFDHLARRLEAAVQPQGEHPHHRRVP